MPFVCGPEKGHESIGRFVAAAMRRVSGTGRTPPVARADATRLGSRLHGIVHMAEPAEGNSRYAADHSIEIWDLERVNAAREHLSLHPIRP